MNKITLSEIDCMYGDFPDMPKGLEIDRDKLQHGYFKIFDVTDSPFPFSKKQRICLNTYMRDHINLEYERTLVNKEYMG